jgi:hypothetical protein
MINLLIRWILSDLRVDAQLTMEDAELMQLGFTWTEAQNMSIGQRQHSMLAAKIVRDFNKLSERRENIDIGIITSGFADKKSRQVITNRWDRDAKENLAAMAEFNLETPHSLLDRGKSKSKPRNFKETLKKLKLEKINNLRARNESLGDPLSAEA